MGTSAGFTISKVKNELDKAACRLIRIKNKSMANELYFRIKANEASFEESRER